MEIVSEQMGVGLEYLTLDTRFVEDLGADSLDSVEMTMAIEETFDIVIPDEDAKSLFSIGEVVVYIQNYEHFPNSSDPDGDDESTALPDDLSDPTTADASGGGFGDAEKNREVERAAVSLVVQRYESEGWTVRSVESDRRGFDLECSRGDRIEHVEVKGTSGRREAFIITDGEKQLAESDPDFFLIVVTDALNEAKLSRYCGREVLEKFDLKPISYKAVRRGD